MASASINLIFYSDIFMSRAVLAAVMAFLENELLLTCPDVLTDMRAVYDELILNAIVNKNNNDADQLMELSVKIEDEKIISTIKSDINGRYSSSIFANNYLSSLLLDDGRSLIIVNSLVDSISFKNVGAEIEFSKIIA